MFKIIIKKTPANRLFDPMPIPRPNRLRMSVTSSGLRRFQSHPFQRTVTKIN